MNKVIYKVAPKIQCILVYLLNGIPCNTEMSECILEEPSANLLASRIPNSIIKLKFSGLNFKLSLYKCNK